ncbi:MAG: CPBP family intramembrane metalloprotease [Bacteroidales bacterium]|nr:CPBP family intramembrane metalloprotease [Bacteroidales bacterium]
MTAKTSIPVAVAAFLWFLMFNPWMGLQAVFWPAMAISSAILLYFSFRRGDIRLRCDWKQIIIGVAIAAALWGIFWLGNKISCALFNFSRPQVDSIYAMGGEMGKWIIALQLIFLTGPAEEIFWRGFVQQSLAEEKGPFAAMCITLTIYALIHIWSFNFMLIMAAMVAGAVWGLLYWLKPSWLPALVISHALWDAAVFVIFPIH